MPVLSLSVALSLSVTLSSSGKDDGMVVDRMGKSGTTAMGRSECFSTTSLHHGIFFVSELSRVLATDVDDKFDGMRCSTTDDG